MIDLDDEDDDDAPADAKAQALEEDRKLAKTYLNKLALDHYFRNHIDA